uniref:Uncharacterized protein n=1 Tax=Strigamia maritima TaxID=126957 RepID=T1JM88_STRMM
MLKFFTVLLILTAEVNCSDPPADCVSCTGELNGGIGVVGAFIAGLEPIIINNASFCNQLIFTNITGLTSSQACLISPPGGTVHTQITAVRVSSMHVECHFDGLLGLLNTSTSDQIMVVDAENVDFDIVTDIDFNDFETANITSLSLEQGDFNSTHFSLQGNSTLVFVGQIITGPTVVSDGIGYVLKFFLRQLVDEAKGNDILTEIVSSIHCAEPEA